MSLNVQDTKICVKPRNKTTNGSCYKYDSHDTEQTVRIKILNRSPLIENGMLETFDDSRNHRNAHMLTARIYYIHSRICHISSCIYAVDGAL